MYSGQNWCFQIQADVNGNIVQINENKDLQARIRATDKVIVEIGYKLPEMLQTDMPLNIPYPFCNPFEMEVLFQSISGTPIHTHTSCRICIVAILLDHLIH